jgi:uncharacterized repeat protein (TIGR02543 family)/LPXTG-motif cell wall-anchored protein
VQSRIDRTMLKLQKIGPISLLSALPLVLALLYPVEASAAAAPVLTGTASSYGVLAGTTITNSGTVTMAGGTVHLNDTAAQNAQLALTTAYEDVRLRTPVTTIASDLAGETLTAGVYTTADTSFRNTGILTLDGGGDPNAMFFFHAGSSLTTADTVASQMHLINQAQACNVYWQLGSSATLGTYSTFVGRLYAQTSITAKIGAQITGQLLARTGAVTLEANTISNPGCNHTVTFNTNTGTGGATAAQTANTPSALTANGFLRPGYTFIGWDTVLGGGGVSYADTASYSFAADLTLYAEWSLIPPVPHTVAYHGNGSTGGTISIDALTPYATGALVTVLGNRGFFVKTGYDFNNWNTRANGSGIEYVPGATFKIYVDTILYAQWTPTPTPTPTPIPMATLHVVKVVANNNGGIAVPSDFTLHAKLHSVDVAGSPATGIGGVGRTYTLPAGSYVVSEDPVAGYVGSFSGVNITTGFVTLVAASEVTITRTNTDATTQAAVVPSPTLEPTVTATPTPPEPTVTGGKLPKTGSPWYNLLALGSTLILIGGWGWTLNGRKSH